MKNSIKLIIQRLANNFGWEIRRFIQPEMVQLKDQLHNRNIELVLDIGGNEGQFGSALLRTRYSGKILSFEPLPVPYKKLVNLASKNKRWQVAERAAVGSSVGKIVINESANSVSSSILPILDSHTSAAPKSQYVDSLTVPIVTLDSINQRLDLTRSFLKIDTQGYEMEVLLGAKGILPDVCGIQVEVSIVQLYEGQPDFLLLLDFIRCHWDCAQLNSHF
jgi:FkbM family methyltransferase